MGLLGGGGANALADALRGAFRERTGMEVAGDFGAVGRMRDRVCWRARPSTS